MVSTALKLVGFDLQRQWMRLKAEAEDFKDRATDEIKTKAVNVGLMIGFALAGLVFVVLTLIVGLAALYVLIEPAYGPLAALGAVAGATALLAAILFVLAATRSGSTKAKVKARANAERVAAAPAAKDPSPTPAQSYEALTRDLADQSMAAANEALDAAAGAIRKSPREVILATLAAAIAIGVVIGRRR